MNEENKKIIMSSIKKNEKPIVHYLTLGFRGLLGSKKGSFCLLILGIATTALFVQKISGMEFCTVITILAGIYASSSAITDIQSMKNTLGQ